VFFALSVLLAWAAARFVGDPLNRLLRRRFVRREASVRGAMATPA
jgi:peptidoglycan/LPS O-acetylase OafA/YrhL